jgi:hypothetical protein
MPTPELIALARAAAAKHALDPALVCAVIEQESAWDPHAIRYEPGFRTRYVAPQGLPPTEEIARSISWGLMQVMGQLAREHGFHGKFLSALCDPALGLEIGCAALAAKITIRQSSVEATGSGRSAGRSGSADPMALPMSDASRKSAGSVEATGSGGSAGLQAREKTSKLEKGFSPGAPEEPQSLSPDTGEGIAPAEIAHALERWNGGANPNYAAEVLAPLPHYK